MGRDKAAIVLAGQSLLERAIGQLAGVSEPVIVAGNAVRVPAGVMRVADPLPACGPMGGVAAALVYARDTGVSWVMFLPVDMPLLPGGLLQALMERWREAAASGAWVCCAEADGRVQPLVSVVHTAVLPALRRSLTAGEYRLRPALEGAAVELALEHGTAPERAFEQTRVEGGAIGIWEPTAAEWRRQGMWFSNVNTPEDLATAERALGDG